MDSVSKFLMRSFTGLHGRLVKATGGMGGGTKDGAVLVLRHTGAKTGKERETPLMFLNHENGYVVVASMGGAPTNPGWYYNLKANPETSVRVGKADVDVRAREVTGEERTALWERLTSLDKRWEQYQSRTERVIPLLALDPR